MTTEKDYFSWLCDRVLLTEDEREHYASVLSDLYDIPYTVVTGFTVDEIRVRKTAELRDDYTAETGILSSSKRPISCLEILVSLAYNLEQSVMRNSFYGDRTHEWFWCMLNNLGLTACDESHYDKEFVWHIITTFATRRYAKDGRGSIAYTSRHAADFTKMDIWQQLNIYISENKLYSEGAYE